MIENKPNILNFIKKEEYTGSMDGMRYMLRRLEENGECCLEVIIWPQPFGYGKTAADLKQRIRFSFSEGGAEEAVEWLNKQYKEQKELWAAAQNFPG